MSALDSKYYDALKEYRSELIKCIDVNDILGEMKTLRPNDEERIRAQLDVSGRTTQSACMELLVHIRRRGKECFFDFLLALEKNKCIEVLNKIINCASCRDDWKKYCETKLSSKGKDSQTCKEEDAAAEPTVGVGEIRVGHVTERTITTRPQVEPPQVEPPQVITNAAAQPDVGGCKSVSLCDVEWGILIDLVQKVDYLKLAKKFSFTGREMKEIKKSTDQVDKFVETLVDKAEEKGWTMETLQSHIKVIDKQEPLKQSIQAVDEKSLQALPSYEAVVGINTSKSPSSFITEEASKGRQTIEMNISKETSELPIIDKSHIQKKSGDVDDNVNFKEKNLNSLSGTYIKDNDKKNVNSTEPNRKQQTGTVGENKAGLIEKTEFSSNAEDIEQRQEPVASVDFHEGLKAGKAAENLNQELTKACGGLPSAQASAVGELHAYVQANATVETWEPEPVASVDFYEDTSEGLKVSEELEAAENMNVGEQKNANQDLKTGGKEHSGVQVSATVETWEPEPVASVDFYEDTSEGLKAVEEHEAAENMNVGQQKIANNDLNTGGKELHSGVQVSANVETWEPEPVASVDFYEDTSEGLKAVEEHEAAENMNVGQQKIANNDLNTGGKELHSGVQVSANVETWEPEPVASVDFYEDTSEGLKAVEEHEAAENMNVGQQKIANNDLNTGGKELHSGVQVSANVETWEPEPVASVDFYEDTSERLKAVEEHEAAENMNVSQQKIANNDLNTGGKELHSGVQVSANVETWEPEPVASVDFYEDTSEGLKAVEEHEAAENMNIGQQKIANNDLNTGGKELHSGVQISANVETWEPEPVASVDFYEDTSEGLKAVEEHEAAENMNVGQEKIANNDLNTGGKELHSGVQVSANVETWEPEPVDSVDFYEDTSEELKAGEELNAVENVGEHADKEHNIGGEELHAGVQASASVKNVEEPELATLDYEDTGEGLKAGAELEAAENLIARETTFSYQELNTAGEQFSAILQDTTIAETEKVEQVAPEVASGVFYEDSGEGLKAGEELKAAEIEHKLTDKEINQEGENLHVSVEASEDSWELDPSELTELSEAGS